MKVTVNHEFQIDNIKKLAKISLDYMTALKTGSTSMQREVLSQKFISSTIRLSNFINNSSLNELKINTASLNTYEKCEVYITKVTQFLAL